MELFLSIVGLILALIPPTAIYVRYRRWRQRLRWSARLQVKRGAIPKLGHYAFEFWRQAIAVDSSGNARHEIDARLANISDGLLEELRFPVYCDATGVPSSAVAPWARSGRHVLSATIDEWDSRHARGRVRIQLDPPVPPGGHRRLRWGYTLPGTFRPGDEYYNWDVATPHFDLSGILRFDPAWSVLYARWERDIANSQRAPRLKNSTIRWLIRFPQPGQRVTMRFGLAHSRTLVNTSNSK